VSVFKTYTLTVSGPDSYPAEEGSAEKWAHEEKVVARILAGRVLADAEDVVNDALPEGWAARIEEWDLERP
jgi:hypothetical protein